MKKLFKLLSFVLLALIISFYTLGGGFGSGEIEIGLGEEPIVFAHRGVPVNTVENSFESFESSKELGFRAIETDIRSTKDGTLVIFHDESCRRLLGMKGKIQDYSWSQVNGKYLAYKEMPTFNKIQTVSEFLKGKQYADILYLDLKKPSLEQLDRLVDLLAEKINYSTIYIADENMFYLAYLKFKNPNLNTILEGYNAGKEFIHYLIPKNFKPDFYASFLSGVNEEHMDFLREHDLLNRRIVYGIDEKNLEQVKGYGLKHIVLDYKSSMGSLEEIENSLKK